MTNTHRLHVIAWCNFVATGLYLWFLLGDGHVHWIALKVE